MKIEYQVLLVRFIHDGPERFARQAEVYAGYMAYVDHEIGREIQAVGN